MAMPKNPAGLAIGAVVLSVAWALNNQAGTRPWYPPMFSKDATAIPQPVTITPPIATTAPSPPPANIALGIDHFLIDFAIQTGSVPYSAWGAYMPDATTSTAYRDAIIAMGMMPNTHFHFNLSSPNGRIDSPMNLSINSGSVTTMEFKTIMTLFQNKTTFYEKSGSIYKKTIPFTGK